MLEPTIEALFPSSCYKCGLTGTYLCYDCYHIIDIVPEPSCPHCEKRLPFGKLGAECKKELALDRLFSCANYKDEGLNKLLKDLKYKYAYKLAEPLATFATWWIQSEGYADEIKNNIDFLVPVPSHKKQLKKRGFNHAELIAKHLSPLLDLPVGEKVLIKTKKTENQVETNSKKEREENLKGAFSVHGDNVSGKNVLLIDDVVTTGSTLRECAKTLKDAGAKEVWGLTIVKE